MAILGRGCIETIGVTIGCRSRKLLGAFNLAVGGVESEEDGSAIGVGGEAVGIIGVDGDGTGMGGGVATIGVGGPGRIIGDGDGGLVMRG